MDAESRKNHLPQLSPKRCNLAFNNFVFSLPNNNHSSKLKTFKTRKDKYGNEICKKTNNHKVTFKDQFDENNRLHEIKRVESYKKFNIQEIEDEGMVF